MVGTEIFSQIPVVVQYVLEPEYVTSFPERTSYDVQ